MVRMSVSAVPPAVSATARDKCPKNKGLSQLSQLSHQNSNTFKDEEKIGRKRRCAPAAPAGTAETNAAATRVSGDIATALSGTPETVIGS